MTSKQRAALRGMANTLDPVFQIGKGGVNDAMLHQIGECLEKRELIKLTLLQSCEADTRSVCQSVAQSLEAEPVQCIGRRFVLYRPAKEPVIDLSAL